MKRTPPNRVPGHALRFGGRAVDPATGQIDPGTPRHKKVGHGVCECGETSGPVAGHTARVEWHREHKEQVTKDATQS